MRAAVQMQPRWVIVGVPWEDSKVAVLASDTLTEAELRAEIDKIGVDYDYDPFTRERWGATQYAMTVQMHTFLIVVADSYQAALGELLSSWAPSAAALASPSARGIEARK